jgi:hypothetical protein
MTPLHVLFLFCFVAAGIYFVFLKPQIDGYSVAFGSTFFYFLPVILGSGNGLYNEYAIHPWAYAFCSVFVLGLVLADNLLPETQIHFVSETDTDSPTHTRILTVLTVVVFAILLVQIDPAWWGAPKSDIPGLLSQRILRYLLPIATVASWIHRDTEHLIVVSAALVFYTALFQVRSPVAMTIISVLLYELHTRNPSIQTRLHLGGIGGIGGAAIVYFDQVKRRLISGDFSVLFEMKRFEHVVWSNNAHIIFQIFNETLARQYRIDNPWTHLASNFFRIIPLSETLFGFPGVKYGALIKPIFFPEREAGIGSNIWAEAFAISGFSALAIALLIYFVGIDVFSDQLDSNAWSMRLFSYCVLPYWTFYSHRLALGALLATISIIAIFCFAPALLVNLWGRTQSMRQEPGFNQSR